VRGRSEVGNGLICTKIISTEDIDIVVFAIEGLAGFDERSSNR